jgi:hypothetical protein
MEELETVLSWILAGTALVAAAAACLLLAGLLRATIGGGLERRHPIPPGFMRHAAEVSGRVRAHNRLRGELHIARTLGWA